MWDPETVQEIFDRFAGQEVQMKSSNNVSVTPAFGDDFSGTSNQQDTVDPQCPVVKAFKKALSQEAGVDDPVVSTSAAAVRGRVTATIEKKKGKWVFPSEPTHSMF
jgi:hypothetical protein